jgi:hypothetical protein
MPNGTLSLSISPSAIHLPATAAGIAPYHGLVTLTDRGTSPVKVTLSAEKLSAGCPSQHGVPWLHLDAQTIGLAPGVPHHVGYQIDGGAAGQAAILATITGAGKGNVHLAGAVGARVVAGTANHQACAAAPPAPSGGSFPWLALALPLVLLAVIAVALQRRHSRRSHYRPQI